MVAKCDKSTSQTTGRKAYEKPTLTKAAALSAITAQLVISSPSDG
jgi:hypothetical protein